MNRQVFSLFGYTEPKVPNNESRNYKFYFLGLGFSFWPTESIVKNVN